MTITIDLSEDVVAAIAEEARQQGCSTTELVAQEIRTRFLVTAPRMKHRSVMEFRGIGAGRPGAIERARNAVAIPVADASHPERRE